MHLSQSRRDVYSLGATLYELLTLCPVFDGNNREALLRQLTFEEPKPLRRLHSGVPADLETIVMKAISKNPDERYQHATEMLLDLDTYLRRRPVVGSSELAQFVGRLFEEK